MPKPARKKRRRPGKLPQLKQFRAGRKPANLPVLDQPTPFASWIAAKGYNRKQVAEAGATLGLSAQAAGFRNRGAVTMSELELLGLTAAYFGLPPWRPDFADKLDDRARTMMRLAAEDIARCLS
jgi:hypothetical protein